MFCKSVGLLELLCGSCRFFFFVALSGIVGGGLLVYFAAMSGCLLFLAVGVFSRYFDWV